MSHFIKAKVQVKDKSILEKALRSLGLTVYGKAIVEVSHQKETVDISFDRSLGMKQMQDGTWELVGDPYYSGNNFLRGFYKKEDQLTKKIAVQYMVEKAKIDLQNANFTICHNSQGVEGKDGLIQMVASRWM